VALESFGVREAGKPEPVNADTVFQLASVSKPIASTVVAALVGRGLVCWDAPVSKYDSDFALSDRYVTRNVTFADLLSHRSGLPDHGGDELDDNGFGRDQIQRRLRQLRLYPFRGQFFYTNQGFTAAALAAAKAYGKSWEETSAEVLYRPLGMTSTSSLYSDFIHAPNRSSIHIWENGGWVAKYRRQPDAQSPAGGVSSSARDMAQWMKLLVGHGTFGGQQVVGKNALDESHRPLLVNSRADTADQRSGFYGIGWGTPIDDMGRVRWSHSGAFGLGASTNVTILPADELGITVLVNTQPIGVPEAMVETFLDILQFGDRRQDWVPLFRQLFLALVKAPVDPPANPLPPRENGAYVGAYTNAYLGDIQITERSGRLALTIGPDHATFPLDHFDGDTFAYYPPVERADGASGVITNLGGAPVAKAPVRFEVKSGHGHASVVHLENYDEVGLGTFHRR
jgi:CubicO group peptidase (beta-lactamase class C family)